MHREKIEKSRALPIKEALRIEDESKKFNIAGTISSIKKFTAKNGKPMAFAKVEDWNDVIEVLVFNDALARSPNVWQENQTALIRGRMSSRNGEYKMICDEAVSL